MIETQRKRLSFSNELIAYEVRDLHEPWMSHANAVLVVEEIVTIVYEAMGKRHPKSRSRGRHGALAETVRQLPVRNWSYEALERAVRASLVYRKFYPCGRRQLF
jgi:transposase, IS5 family